MTNSISTINTNNSVKKSNNIHFGNTIQSKVANQPIKDIYNHNNEPQEDKHLKSKIGILLGVIATTVLAFFYFRKGKGVSKPSHSSSFAEDILEHKIKPPRIEHLTGERYRPNEQCPLEAEYLKIIDNIKEDTPTFNRYTQIISELKNSARKINDKFKEVDASSDFEGEGLERVLERVIQQKRYFSLPGNRQDGYCCLDPLLYKAAREEGLDTQIGYYLLNPFQFGEKPTDALLNGLRTRYAASISPENSSFIDECISRLSDSEAKCCGQDSRFHAHELAKLGKIFRNAIGIEVL